MALEEKTYFCLNDYDCIGVDMDHTVIQYHLPEVFKLIYTALVDFLVTERNYDEKILHVDNFTKHEDFSLRGLVFDHHKGNFLKIDMNGYVLSCSHGMKQLSDEEIIKEYGASHKWPLFNVLQEKVYHGEGYSIMENFFLMPAASIVGQLIEDTDKKSKEDSVTYEHIWQDIISALSLNFQAASFDNDKGMFFPSLKNNISKYVKKCPPSIFSWIKMLRDQGKVVALITDSSQNFASLLMNYAFGEDWKELFDFVIAYANKPNFFYESTKDRPFHTITETGEISPTTVDDIQPHTIYNRGNSRTFEEVVKRRLGKDSLKVVYFGDSMKSDIFPPCVYAKWDTVAVLEELEAEEVHFHKNNTQPSDCKKPKLTPLLKEEKILVASSRWGSFFTHPRSNEQVNNAKQHPLNTFWGDLIRKYSKIAIPLLDYIAELPIDHRFLSFSSGQSGFYPSAPRSLDEDECT